MHILNLISFPVPNSILTLEMCVHCYSPLRGVQGLSSFLPRILVQKGFFLFLFNWTLVQTQALDFFCKLPVLNSRSHFIREIALSF